MIESWLSFFSFLTNDDRLLLVFLNQTFKMKLLTNSRGVLWSLIVFTASELKPSAFNNNCQSLPKWIKSLMFVTIYDWGLQTVETTNWKQPIVDTFAPIFKMFKTFDVYQNFQMEIPIHQSIFSHFQANLSKWRSISNTNSKSFQRAIK